MTVQRDTGSPARYEVDAYARKLRTRVLEVDSKEPWVTLADTILYPEGGGQPSDHGQVAGHDVVELARGDRGVRHLLSASASVAPGDEVEITLDWDRRFDHMQQHSAQHLLTALAHREAGHHTTSFHLGPSVSDIELDGPAMTEADLNRLEEMANEVVREARDIRIHRISRAEYESRTDIRTRGLPEDHRGDVRLIEIAGLDLTACGGTHVASTAELEGIKVLGGERMRGGTRVHWVAGARLRRRLAEHERRTQALRMSLGVGAEELVDAVAQRMDQLKAAQRDVRHLEEDLADALVAGFTAAQVPLVTRHFESGGGAFLKALASRFHQEVPGKVGFFSAGAGDGMAFVIVAGDGTGAPASVLGPAVAAALAGKGGGRDPFFQGKAPGPGGLDEGRTAILTLLEGETG